MKRFFAVLWAEAKKGHRLNFHNPLIYFSLFIWPAIMFVSAYYSFKPFNLQQGSPLQRFLDPADIGLFLLTGYLAYIFFWSLVQSAWLVSFERYSGTLELIFLSPVSRLGFIYGRAAADLVEGVWLFFVFSMLVTILIGGFHASWWGILVALTLLTVSSVIWGGLLNVIFLFSRDASFLYTILDEPMSIFSGVKIPVGALPLWGKAIAHAFPLTYVLQIFRDLVMGRPAFSAILPSLAGLFAILSFMVLFTIWLVRKAEEQARRTGSLNLF